MYFSWAWRVKLHLQWWISVKSPQPLGWCPLCMSIMIWNHDLRSPLKIRVGPDCVGHSPDSGMLGGGVGGYQPQTFLKGDVGNYWFTKTTCCFHTLSQCDTCSKTNVLTYIWLRSHMVKNSISPWYSSALLHSCPHLGNLSFSCTLTILTYGLALCSHGRYKNDLAEFAVISVVLLQYILLLFVWFMCALSLYFSRGQSDANNISWN